MDVIFLGGERGIRTLGTIAGTTVFKTVPFNHSGTSPYAVVADYSNRFSSVSRGADGQQQPPIRLWRQRHAVRERHTLASLLSW